jgi:hypothetical protein
MNRAVALTLMFLTTFVAAFGNTYCGTITQTITSTNDPLYHIGQTFTGYYSYESSCIDGTFDGPAPWRPDLSDNTSLDGEIYMPFAAKAHFDFYMGGSHVVYDLKGSGGKFNELPNTPNHPGSLVVTNGCITDFFWAFENGGFWMWATENNFQALSFYDRGPHCPATSGSIALGNPTRVPDVTSTLPLLAGALLGFGLIRRRFAS